MQYSWKVALTDSVFCDLCWLIANHPLNFICLSLFLNNDEIIDIALLHSAASNKEHILYLFITTIQFIWIQ